MPQKIQDFQISKRHDIILFDHKNRRAQDGKSQRGEKNKKNKKVKEIKRNKRSE